MYYNIATILPEKSFNYQLCMILKCFCVSFYNLCRCVFSFTDDHDMFDYFSFDREVDVKAADVHVVDDDNIIVDMAVPCQIDHVIVLMHVG